MPMPRISRTGSFDRINATSTQVVKRLKLDVNDVADNSVNSAGSVNSQNAIRKGDQSVTPLRFVYEAADCRFFYTAEMLEQQSPV